MYKTGEYLVSAVGWNFPVEYPNREYIHHIMEYEGNMFNPIDYDMDNS